jgi:hypothetical protein
MLRFMPKLFIQNIYFKLFNAARNKTRSPQLSAHAPKLMLGNFSELKEGSQYMPKPTANNTKPKAIGSGSHRLNHTGTRALRESTIPTSTATQSHLGKLIL